MNTLRGLLAYSNRLLFLLDFSRGIANTRAPNDLNLKEKFSMNFWIPRVLNCQYDIPVKPSIRHFARICRLLVKPWHTVTHHKSRMLDVMNCSTVKQFVLKKTLSLLNKEVSSLCSKSNPSLLRKLSKEDLEKFDLEPGA